MKRACAKTMASATFPWTAIAAAAVLLLAASCSSAPKTAAPEPARPARAATSDDELKIVDSSKRLVGMKPNAKVVVNGKTFTLDCIGTVCAIYYRLNIDLAKDFDDYPGNGVNRLYMSLDARGVLHRDRYPRTGDVIFWDNTWDANGDADRTNDPRTHAGIVLAVDDDGTIHYVHENLYKGVVIETMNLLKPTVAIDDAGKKINSGMAIATLSGGPKPERNLAGDVFNTFGDPLKAKVDFMVASPLEKVSALPEAEK
jgi:hypothetical protein